MVIASRRVELGREAVREIEEAGGIALFIPIDVARASDMETLVTKTVEAFGRLDYALNNAARVDEALIPLADLTEEDFDKTIGINLKGVWLGMKYQIRQMLA